MLLFSFQPKVYPLDSEKNLMQKVTAMGMYKKRKNKRSTSYHKGKEKESIKRVHVHVSLLFNLLKRQRMYIVYPLKKKQQLWLQYLLPIHQEILLHILTYFLAIFLILMQ